MHAYLASSIQLLESVDTLEIHPDTSIGIAEVHQIQSFLSKKPMSSDHNTVVIHEAEKLTLPAQHAILKTLEEPPGDSQIYLITSFPDQLLPTILSRVQIIQSSIVIPNVVKESLSSLINSLISAGVRDRLKILDSQNFTRDSFLEFLIQLEYFVHDQIQNNHRLTINYELIATTRKYLKANCNLKLVLIHLALNL